jgi:Domain of unknown function (DUF4926)
VHFNQYDVVKIVEIINPAKAVKSEFDFRAPEVGDVATVVEVYSTPCLGYELECSDKEGITQWLVTFKPSELHVTLLWSAPNF